MALDSWLSSLESVVAGEFAPRRRLVVKKKEIRIMILLAFLTSLITCINGHRPNRLELISP